MYTRTLISPNHSFFLFGPRATGKTTWLRNTIKSSLWLNLLLDEELIPVLNNTSEFRARIDALPKESWIVIDEVQKAPALLNHVHDVISLRGDELKFALSGSSARKLKKLEVNLLAGRVVQWLFFPLTFAELKEEYDINLALSRGLLPGIVSRPDAAVEMLEAYVGMYLKEEIRQEALVKDIASFSRFLRVASIMNGQILSYSNIAREAGVARSTIERYFQILEDTLIGTLVQAWQPRAKVREVTQPKFFFFDCGVLRAIKGDLRQPVSDYEKGFLLETLMLHEMRAAISYLQLGGEIFHWRTSAGSEIDFIYQRGTFSVGIEVKASQKWRPEYGKSLKGLLSEQKIARGIVLYDGEYRTLSNGVEGIPFKEFLKDLWEGAIFTR